MLPKGKSRWVGDRRPARRSPLQACQPCKALPPLKSSPDKILHAASCFSNCESPSFLESLSCLGMCVCTYVYIPGRGRGKSYMPWEERSGRPDPTTAPSSAALRKCCAPQRAAKLLSSNRRKTLHSTHSSFTYKPQATPRPL